MLPDVGAIWVGVKDLRLKGSIWYFRRRIPEDVRSL
jgi:hypothetical protein